MFFTCYRSLYRFEFFLILIFPLIFVDIELLNLILKCIFHIITTLNLILLLLLITNDIWNIKIERYAFLTLIIASFLLIQISDFAFLVFSNDWGEFSQFGLRFVYIGCFLIICFRPLDFLFGELLFLYILSDMNVWHDDISWSSILNLITFLVNYLIRFSNRAHTYIDNNFIILSSDILLISSLQINFYQMCFNQFGGCEVNLEPSHHYKDTCDHPKEICNVIYWVVHKCKQAHHYRQHAHQKQYKRSYRHTLKHHPFLWFILRIVISMSVAVL